MKFSKVVFTHPITIPFTGEDGRPRDGFSNSVGSVCINPNQTTPPVESIEERGHWVLIRYMGQIKAVPAAKVDCVDVLDDGAEGAKKGKAAA